MTAEAPRVALLARPGVASDRLQEVLAEAGVHSVLRADPTQLDAPDLVASDPQVVLVALDAATEDVLARFDAVLGDPAINVIYEEADLAAGREGWDAARWKRHLVAKLQGHKDVLPPGGEPMPSMETVAAPAATAGYASFDPVNAEGGDAGFSDFDITFDLEGVPAPEQATAAMQPYAFDGAFDPVVAQRAADALTDAPAGLELDAGDADGTASGSLGFEAAAHSDVALDSAFVEAALEFAGVREESAQDASVASPRLELSLDDGAGIPMARDSGAANDRFQHDLEDIERRISSLQLVDDTPARGPELPRGLVLVMAGIGGPDAVRQLLGALPDSFPRPVLVRQRLDGGRYDKLVAQMQRATKLPVTLADAGSPLAAGTVYIVAPELGVADDGDGLRFSSGGDLLDTLASDDSAILLLSGSDPDDIDAVMKHQWAGALVAGQSPDGCYDAVAPAELAARGGDTGQPADLAQRLVERWPV